MAKVNNQKMTLKQDAAYDKKHGLKEGSKKDIAQDKKHGVYAEEMKNKMHPKK